jgi:hypothetical protein
MAQLYTWRTDRKTPAVRWRNGRGLVRRYDGATRTRTLHLENKRAYASGDAVHFFNTVPSVTVRFDSRIVLFGLSIGGPNWLLLVDRILRWLLYSGGQTPIRSTAVGWALGIGRLGGIGGPLLIGALRAYHLSAEHILYAAAVPMLLRDWLSLCWAAGMRAGNIWD